MATASETTQNHCFNVCVARKKNSVYCFMWVKKKTIIWNYCCVFIWSWSINKVTLIYCCHDFITRNFIRIYYISHKCVQIFVLTSSQSNIPFYCVFLAWRKIWTDSFCCQFSLIDTQVYLSNWMTVQYLKEL